RPLPLRARAGRRGGPAGAVDGQEQHPRRRRGPRGHPADVGCRPRSGAGHAGARAVAHPGRSRRLRHRRGGRRRQPGAAAPVRRPLPGPGGSADLRGRPALPAARTAASARAGRHPGGARAAHRAGRPARPGRHPPQRLGEPRGELGDRASDAGAEVAVRRPAAPHLRPGRPGAPAPAPAAAPVVPAPVEAARVEAAPASPPRAGRRAVLLGGAAAAVGGAVLTGALLRTEGPEAPSVASSEGSGPGEGSPSALFPDVPADDPGAEAIRWAHETGVQPAPSAAGYSPQTAVTRGDVAVALHRLAGTPAVDLQGLPVLFTDLGEDPARVAAVLWLHGRGALWGDAELQVH